MRIARLTTILLPIRDLGARRLYICCDSAGVGRQNRSETSLHHNHFSILISSCPHQCTYGSPLSKNATPDGLTALLQMLSAARPIATEKLAIGGTVGDFSFLDPRNTSNSVGVLWQVLLGSACS